MKIVRLLVVLALVALAAAVVAVPAAREQARLVAWRVRAVPLGTLARHARDGDVVHVSGQVTARLDAPLARRSAFVLTDRTGAARVTTDARLPALGASVLVRARVQRAPVAVSGATLGDVTLDALELVEPAARAR